MEKILTLIFNSKEAHLHKVVLQTTTVYSDYLLVLLNQR